MPGIKKHDYEFTGDNNRITPDEIDQYRQYVIMNPSVSATYFGTAASANAVAITAINTRADYPRNMLLSVTGVAGGMGGTAVINGVDQFGGTIQESIGFASAAGGGTQAGTKVFARYTDGTFTPQGLGGTAVGTVSLGVAISTASNSPLFGLLDKLGGTADVKAVTWLDSGVAKQHGAASHADTTNHAIRIEVTGGVAAADSYVVLYRPTKDLSNEGYQADLS